MSIEIREHVFDEDLASDPFAEEADVAADNGSQIEQDRRLPRGQATQKLAQGLGGIEWLTGRRRHDGAHVRFYFARRNAIEKAHGRKVRVPRAKCKVSSKSRLLTYFEL